MRRLGMLGAAVGTVSAGASLVFVLAASLLAPRSVAAATPAIAIGAATASVGSDATVSLQALDMAAPGLAAWSMNIVYDASVVQLAAQPQGCAPQSGSVCNPTFAPNTIRVAGATATGLVGDATLATFTFRCTRTSTSALTVTVDTLADATPGEPAGITASTSNGSVACVAAPAAGPATTAPTATPAPGGPNAGFGPDGSGPGLLVWLVAGLGGAGLAWLSAGLAGAGLAAVAGSERRPARDGFLPRMRPLVQRKQRHAGPKSTSSALPMPPFRPLDRPDRKR